MTIFARFIRWFVYALGGVVVAAVAAILFIGFTQTGSAILASRVSQLASTPQQTVTISPPRGLLGGNLRLDRVTVADEAGIYAEIRDIELDWSPLKLFAMHFDAQRLAAGAINVSRLPRGGSESAGSSSGAGNFSLPVTVRVREISLPDIRLGSALAGRDFALAASGSAEADTGAIDATLDVSRKDEPDARAHAEFSFAPSENRLKLAALLAEPQGGLLAGLLSLPDAPAISLSLDGEGPLSAWNGRLQGSVAGQQVLDVAGKHLLSQDGTRRIELSGGGHPETLIPPLYRQLFSGETGIELAVNLGANGAVEIDNGNITTGALLLTASGKIDPAGNSNLAANLLGTAGPVDFRMPMGDGVMRLLIDGVDLSLEGQPGAARLVTTASLRSVELPQGRFGQVMLRANGRDLDAGARTGTIMMQLSLAEANFNDPNLARALRAPVMVAVPLKLAGDVISFDPAALESASIGGNASGQYDLAAGELTANVKLYALPLALPEALAPRFDSTIAIESAVRTTATGLISLENLAVKSGTLDAGGNVSLDNGTLAAKITGNLPDLGRFLADASGAARFDIDASGPVATPAVKAKIDVASATLAGRKLEGLALNADATVDPAAPRADITASGKLDGQDITADASLVQQNGVASIPALSVRIGRNVIDGKLAFSPQFLPAGTVSFDFPDISLLAALGGQKAAGDLKGNVALANDNGVLSARVAASGTRIAQGTSVIERPRVDLAIADVMALNATGTVEAATVRAGAAVLEGLRLGLDHSGQTTRFDLGGRYDGAPLELKGGVTTGGSDIRINLATFSATPNRVPLRLAEPADIVFSNGTARFSGLTIRSGDGRVRIDGSAGERLDIKAAITALPASLANAFAAGLDAAGSISGTVSVSGTAGNPSVDYDLAWADAAVSQTRAAGLGALSIRANGAFAGGRLTVQTGVNGQGGLSLSGGGALAIAGNRDLSLSFTGNLPFSALAAQTAAQGLLLEGTAAVDVRIAGTAASPVVTGSVRTDGAKLIDVRRNLTLNAIGATLTFDRDRLVVERLSGRIASGGSLSVAGTVGIAAGSGFPADLTVTLDRASYADGTLVAATANGTLTLKGPLLSAPVLGGSLQLSSLAITIPQRLPASLTAIDIKHRNAPAKVVAQSRNMESQGSEGGASSSVGLDLRIEATNGIFVRGRGIDAELGGSLVVRGTAADPVVSGAFTMRRGRMEVLARRLDFTTGTITFGGALIPVLDMAASTVSGSTTITVSVSGVANDPAITFSSSPSLPQDEVLAQLIFGQSMSKLSALQIARLADAASQLAGGRSTSLFDALRSNLGVDDLDVTTDDKGDTSVSAGKRLNDRTYIQLEQGGSSGGKASINLDIGRGVKLRGSAGADGSGGAGIFYEKEY